MSGVSQQQVLRPLERRIVRLLEEGIDEAEIAGRFRRSPDWVLRVASMARMPRSRAQPLRPDVLRPLERRVLRWRSGGAAPPPNAPPVPPGPRAPPRPRGPA